MTRRLFSIIESPAHPGLSALYARLGLAEIRLTSMRKALQQLKQQPPDVVVADFIYGYGNNYAGVNISNLDVFLHGLQRYAPTAKVIVLVEKSERQYVDKLNEILPLQAVLHYPVTEASMANALQE
jgi:DNA-binding NarL/FixJ family response regulator